MNEVVIDWLGGNCPVQAEGMIAGKPFYFRARGTKWQLEVEDDCGNPEWVFVEQFGSGPYDAGWMSEEEARGFIYETAKRYLEEVLNDSR